MREVDTIFHPHCSVKIYNYNKKYIVKLSFGDNAVEYRIEEQNLPGGVTALKKVFDQNFIDKHAPIFTKMSKDLQEAFEKADE